MGAKLDFYKTAMRNRAKKGFLGFPVATVAFYGPDDRRATKIALGIINGEDEEPHEMKRWLTEKGDIRRDAAVFEAMFRITQSRQVRSVAMTEEILGCPHEEGIDYPEGEACPQCPFWAGRERPLDRDFKESQPKIPDFRSMEKTLAGLGKTEKTPSTNLETAQDLMWDAWDTPDHNKRVAMAKRALEISGDCADAYVMLAEETARTAPQALDLYQKGVAAGERALGPKLFEERVGDFWHILETRPYMRARKGLAQCLHEMGRLDEAIEIYVQLLRLNPNDNQGNRDVLAGCYLEAGRDAEALELLNRYPEDLTASWTYTAALVQFRLHGPSDEAKRALHHALSRNSYVSNYLRGLRRMPHRMPSHFALESVEEAVCYADTYAKCWRSTPGAIQWLESEEG